MPSTADFYLQSTSGLPAAQETALTGETKKHLKSLW